MRDLHQEFKMQLELVASACGVKLGIFQRSRGLREFVADASPEASDPRDVVRRRWPR